MAGQYFAQYLPQGEQTGAETRYGQQLFRRCVQHAADIVETQQQFPGQVSRGLSQGWSEDFKTALRAE